MKKKLSSLVMSLILAFCLFSPSVSGQDTWKIIKVSNSELLNNAVSAIYQNKVGDIWIGTKKGLNIVRNDTWSEFTKDDGLPYKAVTDFCEDINGHIWVATLKGIAKYDGKNWMTINSDNGLINNAVYSLMSDSKGNVWVGTKKGVSVFDGQNWKSYNANNGLIHNLVLDIMEGLDGKIWFATKKGISEFHEGYWKSYDKKDGLARNTVWSMDMTSDGIIWIGTHTGAFNIFDGTNWQLVKKGSGYYRAGNLAIGLLLGLSMTIVVGPYIGAAFFVTFAILGATPSASNATRVYVDTKNNIWLSAQPKGAFMFDGQNWMEYNTKNGLPHKRVSAFQEMSNGDMWIGTAAGIAVLKK